MNSYINSISITQAAAAPGSDADRVSDKVGVYANERCGGFISNTQNYEHF